MERKFKLGDKLQKKKGSQWRGKVVGFYSTELTPIGYAIESDTEKGSVQIYPEAALERVPEYYEHQIVSPINISINASVEDALDSLNYGIDPREEFGVIETVENKHIRGELNYPWFFKAIAENENTYGNFVAATTMMAHGEALMKCLEIWAHRQPKYGNSWQDSKEYRLLAMIVEKADRLERNFNSGNQNYETKEDTLIDIVNWALFYLQNLYDGKYEVKK